VILTELNIKKEIGKRILEARKAQCLTLKELGERAGGLKQTRLTNWEQGTRAPGPEEIKLLAQVLDVSPAFLMCLSDERKVKKIKKHSHLIPLLDHHQACDAKVHIDALRDQASSDNVALISVSTMLLPELSADAFALKMVDESMTPDIRVGDVLVVDLSVYPKPGDYVVALIEDEIIVRKYKQLSASKDAPEYELVSLNNDWANICSNVKKTKKHRLGTVLQKIQTY
jgi:SOS-response transcriptional repressor LexA